MLLKVLLLLKLLETVLLALESVIFLLVIVDNLELCVDYA